MYMVLRHASAVVVAVIHTRPRCYPAPVVQHNIIINMMEPTPLKRRKELLLGFAFLGATVAAWIVASFITQALVTPESGGGDDVPPLEPWLLTLLCSGMFIVYLPVGGVAGRLWQRKKRRGRLPWVVWPHALHACPIACGRAACDCDTGS